MCLICSCTCRADAAVSRTSQDALIEAVHSTHCNSVQIEIPQCVAAEQATTCTEGCPSYVVGPGDNTFFLAAVQSSCPDINSIATECGSGDEAGSPTAMYAQYTLCP